MHRSGRRTHLSPLVGTATHTSGGVETDESRPEQVRCAGTLRPATGSSHQCVPDALSATDPPPTPPPEPDQE